MVPEKLFPTIVGVYETRVGAEDAVAALQAAGFRDDKIGLEKRDWDGWYQISLAPDAAQTGVRGRTHLISETAHPSRPPNPAGGW